MTTTKIQTAMNKINLLNVLIEESAECLIDAHTPFADYNKARQAMSVEIDDARRHFDDREGEFLVDVETCQEWRTEDGYGYTVGIEELTVQE